MKKLCPTLQTHSPHAQPSARVTVIIITALEMNIHPWPYQNASNPALLCACGLQSKVPKWSFWSKPQSPAHKPAWHPAEPPSGGHPHVPGTHTAVLVLETWPQASMPHTTPPVHPPTS